MGLYRIAYIGPQARKRASSFGYELVCPQTHYGLHSSIRRVRTVRQFTQCNKIPSVALDALKNVHFLRGHKRVRDKGEEKRLFGKTTPIKLIYFTNNLETSPPTP